MKKINKYWWYFGEFISIEHGNLAGCKYTAYTSMGILKADTLAGIKKLIKDIQ